MARSVPILMYHRIDTVPGDRNTVLSDDFAQQMKFLKNAGYHTIKLDDLYKYLTGQAGLPLKPVLLTFDDGYEDNYLYALPLLKEYGHTAAVFPVVKWLGHYGEWKKMNDRERLMTWEQLAEWRDAGMEIGAHTVHHVDLRKLSAEALVYELTESKNILESELSIAINYLCYPYGAFNDQVQHYAKGAGYKAALAIFEGTVMFGTDDLYALPRVAVSSRTPIWEFKLKVSLAFRIFAGLRILERKIKQLVKT